MKRLIKKKKKKKKMDLLVQTQSVMQGVIEEENGFKFSYRTSNYDARHSELTGRIGSLACFFLTQLV